jgi:hypothetical protein
MGKGDLLVSPFTRAGVGSGLSDFLDEVERTLLPVLRGDGKSVERATDA